MDYSVKGHYYIATVRPEVCRMAELLRPNSAILDVGAGYGNNARLLLEKGHAITAIEANPDAARSLAALGQIFPGQVTVFQGSVDSCPITQEAYDAVICCMVLHFLDGREVGSLVLNKIKDSTKPGGLNLIISYLETSKLPRREYSFLLARGELQLLYRDWETVWYEESYPRNWRTVRSAIDIVNLARGRRGHKAGRLLSRKPTL